MSVRCGEVSPQAGPSHSKGNGILEIVTKWTQLERTAAETLAGQRQSEGLSSGQAKAGRRAPVSHANGVNAGNGRNVPKNRVYGDAGGEGKRRQATAQ